MPKKKWEKPKLIALVKSKSEEAVLLDCKASALSGPDMVASGCFQTPGVGCFVCRTIGPS